MPMVCSLYTLATLFLLSFPSPLNCHTFFPRFLCARLRMERISLNGEDRQHRQGPTTTNSHSQNIQFIRAWLNAYALFSYSMLSVRSVYYCFLFIQCVCIRVHTLMMLRVFLLFVFFFVAVVVVVPATEEHNIISYFFCTFRWWQVTNRWKWCASRITFFAIVYDTGVVRIHLMCLVIIQLINEHNKLLASFDLRPCGA